MTISSKNPNRCFSSLTIRIEKNVESVQKFRKSLLFHYQLLSHKTYFDTKFNQNKPDQTLEPIEK